MPTSSEANLNKRGLASAHGPPTGRLNNAAKPGLPSKSTGASKSQPASALYRGRGIARDPQSPLVTKEFDESELQEAQSTSVYTGIKDLNTQDPVAGLSSTSTLTGTGPTSDSSEAGPPSTLTLTNASRGTVLAVPSAEGTSREDFNEASPLAPMSDDPSDLVVSIRAPVAALASLANHNSELRQVQASFGESIAAAKLLGENVQVQCHDRRSVTQNVINIHGSSIHVGDRVQAGSNDPLTKKLERHTEFQERDEKGEPRHRATTTWKDNFTPSLETFTSAFRRLRSDLAWILHCLSYPLSFPVMVIVGFFIWNIVLVPCFQWQVRDATKGWTDVNRDVNRLVCAFPFVGRFKDCSAEALEQPSGSGTTSQSPNYPQSQMLTAVHVSTFSELLNKSLADSSIYSLGVKMEDARVATRALAREVDRSTLVGRTELASKLKLFAGQAEATGDSLRAYHENITDSLTDIMLVDELANKTIEAAIDNARRRRSFAWALLWWRREEQPEESVAQVKDRELRKLFRISHENFQTLFDGAHAIITELNNMERSFGDIHTVYGEAKDANDGMTDPRTSRSLSSLWASLAGDRRDIIDYEKNLRILDNLATYTQETDARVSASLVSIKRARDDLKKLESKTSPQNIESLHSSTLEAHWTRVDWKKLGDLQSGRRRAVAVEGRRKQEDSD